MSNFPLALGKVDSFFVPALLTVSKSAEWGRNDVRGIREEAEGGGVGSEGGEGL